MTGRNVPLPPPELRWGGSQAKNDDFFINSAIGSVNRLKSGCNLNKGSCLLDIGCGPGRMLIGIDRVLGSVKHYIGIDVHKPCIDWCKVHLEPVCTYANFLHLPINNARYNPTGQLSADNFSINTPFDVAYLSSVFTHMKLAEVERYLVEMRKNIKKEGYIYCTAFVEQNVPIETENPKDYITDWSGPLHCVRFNRFYFEDMLLRIGFRIESYQRMFRGHGQTHYVLRPNDEPYTSKFI